MAEQLFDPACQDCAEHFLCDEPYTPANVKSLAYAIQVAVEEWFRERDSAKAEAQ